MNNNQLTQALLLLRKNPKYLLGLLIIIFLFVIFLISVITSLTGFVKKGSPLELPETKQIEIQQQADEEFSKQINLIESKYPWYENLPEKNNKYFVAFDEKEQTFYVSLYSNNNPALNGEYKNQLYLDLEKIGVATQSYKFNFTQRASIQ